MLRHWLAMGLAVACAAAVLVGGVRWTMRPITYRAAVIELLVQREVVFAMVQVHEDCWPAQQCFVTEATHTLATVLVWRDNARNPSYGLLSCYDRRGDCYLDIAELGIVRAPLRDLRGVWTMPKQLARVIEDSIRWVRGMSWYRYPSPAKTRLETWSETPGATIRQRLARMLI